MGISEWVYKTFNKKVPKYRIYGHKWRVVTKEDGMWDIVDEEEIVTLFTSDKMEILLTKANELRAYHMKANDGFMYSFYVTKNKDPDKKWILII